MVQTGGFSPHVCFLITVIKRYSVIFSYFCLSFWGRSINGIKVNTPFSIDGICIRYTNWPHESTGHISSWIHPIATDHNSRQTARLFGGAGTRLQGDAGNPVALVLGSKDCWFLDLFKVSICLGFTPFIRHGFGVQRHPIPILDFFRRWLFDGFYHGPLTIKMESLFGGGIVLLVPVNLNLSKFGWMFGKGGGKTKKCTFHRNL